MFSPMMCLLVISMLVMPMLLTGRVTEQFLKITASFVGSIFSSTIILFLITIVLVIFNIFF